MEIDKNLFLIINHFRFYLGSLLAPLFSNPKFLYLAYGILFGLFALKVKRLKVIFLALLLMISGYLLSDAICGRILKPLFHRPRPFLVMKKVYKGEGNKIYINSCASFCSQNSASYSFPSCHATNTAFASFYLSFLFPMLLPIATFLIILVGWSRIYLGVHYPLDILGGWITGFLIAFLFYKLYSFLKSKL